jgi:hypothetical protein
VEMRLTRGRLPNIDPRYLMAIRSVEARVILSTCRSVFRISAV